MEQNPIVSMTLTKDGNRIAIEPDGYVGKLTRGLALLEITVSPNCAAFHVDTKKNIIPKKDLSQDENLHVFSLRIPIDVDLAGVYCTKYRSNNFRLLEMKESLELNIWEIALVSRGGDFFVTVEHAYEFSCYRDRRNAIVCPYFEGKPHTWPQLVDMLSATLADIVDALPDVSECKEMHHKSEELGLSTGQVLWWSSAQGFGAIRTYQGDAFVHWNDIVSDCRLKRLVRGEKVIFDCLTTLDSRDSSFKYKAYGVCFS